MSQNIEINTLKETDIIGHSGDDPTTRVSVKLAWQEKEGLWFQAFRLGGEEEAWSDWSFISANLPYDTLLKYVKLYTHKNKLSFGEIAHSSLEQLKKLQIEKFPRLGQIEIFPLAGDWDYAKTVKCEFTRCQKKYCLHCQLDIETSWIGCVFSRDVANQSKTHIIEICPRCGFQDKTVI